MKKNVPLEWFTPLQQIEGLWHGFFQRVPGVDVAADKCVVMDRLGSRWGAFLKASNGPDFREVVRAEQIHGAEVAVLSDAGEKERGVISGVDGLVALQSGIFLGIVVADCCAVYVVDPVQQICGLFHSGKKGSVLGICRRGVQLMCARGGSHPEDLIAVLSPCIRPPHYEIDFAAMIREQLEEVGVSSERVYDAGVCTASDPERYYSYRRENGKTGRMLAVLGFVGE